MVSILSLKQKFFVTLENVFSDAELINCEVPKGSLLGSLLFLIYIKDLTQALNETGSHLYAGNTCIFYQDKDVEKIERVLNKEFSSLCEWLTDNNLQFILGMIKQKKIFLSKEKPTKTIHII